MNGIYSQKNSPYYWIRYYDKYEPDPKRRRKSFNTKIKISAQDLARLNNNKKILGNAQVKSLAERFRYSLNERNIDLTTGLIIQKVRLLSEVLNEYLIDKPFLKSASRNLYNYSVKRFTDILNDRPVNYYTKSDFNRFIQTLNSDNINTTTISTLTKHLSVIFNYAKKQHYITDTIIQIKPAPPGNPFPIPPAELMNILQYYIDKGNREHRFIVYLMHYTGMRQSSLKMLTWNDIDFDNNYIRANNVKGKKYFMFPLHTKLKELLLEYRKPTGKLISHEYDRFKFWERDIKRMLASGLISRKYQMYQLRDTFATILSRNGIDVSIIQDLLNHSDIKITKNNYLMTDIDRYRTLLNNKF